MPLLNFLRIKTSKLYFQTFYSGETTTIEADFNDIVDKNDEKYQRKDQEPVSTDVSGKISNRLSSTSSERTSAFNSSIRGYRQTQSSPSENLSPVFGSRKGSGLSSGATTATTSSDYVSAVSVPRIRVQKESSSVPVENVDAKKDVTGSLRSTRSACASTHRLGKLCVWVVVQRLEDPVNIWGIFRFITLALFVQLW